MPEMPETYTAFALDDPDYGTPGITVQQGDGAPVESADLSWADGEWDADEADGILADMGFRRVGLWEYLSPQYVAEVVATPETP